MLHTFETRLSVDQALPELLSANACHWSWGLRKAWSLLYREKLTVAQAYPHLTKSGFTSEQAKSLLTAAEMRHSGLVELKKYELQQLELAIAKRERAVAEKSKKIATLEKRQAALRAKRNAAAPRSGKQPSKKYLEALANLREIPAELAFCRNWVRQKERALAAKRGKLAAMASDIEAGRYKLCFGSAKLLSQRPGAHNAETTPFSSVEDWQRQWNAARNGQWWSVGATKKPSGNAEVQWLVQTKQLRVRLTDRIAEKRMDERGVPRSGGKQSDMPKRMQCRFIVIDNVDFTSHKGLASAALQGAFGRQPVTMRVLKRLQEDGSFSWYVQASVDVPTGFTSEAARSRVSRVLGVDLNARAAAWCAVKPDGNRLVKGGAPQRGFIEWSLKGKSDAERKQIIGTAMQQIAAIAQNLSLGVAMENLDFATKKLTMRAGAVSKRYNEMLASLASAQFAKMLARACEKLRVAVYRVNPSYSSVGGYAKYGRLNRCNADEAAAQWLARQALFGTVWKSDGALQYVKKHDEKLVFPHLPVTRTQSTKALAGVQWRDVSRGLGKNRKAWGAKLHAWLDAQVEATSQSNQDEPGKASLPPGEKKGYQPGMTSTPGDALCVSLVAAC